jgi:hypothetical protein
MVIRVPIRRALSVISIFIFIVLLASCISESPLIPYGTYVHSDPLGITSSWTFNRDGTCSLESNLTGRIVGTYTVSDTHISISDGITGHPPLNIKYQYVDNLKCLYLYSSDTDQSPQQYIRQ